MVVLIGTFILLRLPLSCYVYQLVAFFHIKL